MSFENQSENVRFPQIAHEIKTMFDVDQAMRERSQQETGFWDETVDLRHTERMKEIIAEIGWPTASKVGKEMAHGAWLLIQHADHDVQFQILCLNLMKECNQDEVEKRDIAYLEDRIRVNQRKGQLYGTQFTQEDNKHIPLKIEDEENVDARRAEVGMGPLSEQIQHMYNKYPFDKK